VPNSKNAGIPGFPALANLNLPFINPKGWHFSPRFGIGDSGAAKAALFARAC
jgi:hypothetical protein